MKAFLVALGVIVMIGGLTATGCLYNIYGIAAFGAAGAGIGAGLIPIVIAACRASPKKRIVVSQDDNQVSSIERTVVFLYRTRT
ncbi:MAG: hypothetical protein JJU12_04675 [Chlamydiales bacterium]|nr:hypothetical protein [Chlamydiales bacterium]